MLTVYLLFSSVQFSFSALYQLEQLSHSQQSPVSLPILLPDVVIATDPMPSHWAFYIWRSELPLLASGSLSVSMCKAHIDYKNFWMLP